MIALNTESLIRALALIAAAAFCSGRQYTEETSVLTLADRWGEYVRNGNGISDAIDQSTGDSSLGVRGMPSGPEAG